MAERYDVLGASKYMTRDGEEKTFFFKVGTMFPNKQGKDQFSLELLAYPIADKEGKVRLLIKPPEPREGQQRPQERSAPRSTSAAIDDDLPF
jgi:hypothetical protein